MLVEDQRYCLRCGLRRGKPRIDFTAFWAPLSPTGGSHEPSMPRSTTSSGSDGDDGSDDGSWLIAGAPSRWTTGVLAAGVLAAGILAGFALGPGPTSSPADSSTLEQRALASLVARADSASRTSTTTTPAATPSKSEATTTTIAASTSHRAKTAPKSASSEASVPSSPEGSSSGEPSTGSSSEGSTTGSSSGGSTKSSKESGEGEKTPPGTPIKLPPIKHVWLIALSGESFANAIAHSHTDPYLAKRLVPEGTLLSGYTLTASSELANGIALLSGQGVNLDTEQNCPTYTEVEPPTVSTTTGLTEGVGCVYPHEVQTLADELTAGGLTWKAYVQDMEDGVSGTSLSSTSAASGSPSPTPSNGAPSSTSSAPSTATQAPAITCRHPELGGADTNQTAAPGDPYLTYRNPFVYFHSLLDAGACASDDVDLSRLPGDLQTPANTPSLSWIVPSACNDGSSTPCGPGAPAGLAPADAFLREVMPQILATSAYRKEGLIVIVPDSAPSSTSAAAKPVGALLISPFVHAGASVAESLNDFSLSKSLARLFGVLPLGHANDPSAVSFGAGIYSKSGNAASAAATAKKAAQAASIAQPRRRALSDLLDRGAAAAHAGG